MFPRLLLAAMLACAPVHAADLVTTLDLKPFTGESHFNRQQAEWLLPTGPQVFNGVPFQIDGIVELQGNAGPRPTPRTTVSDISVEKEFDELHVLSATSKILTAKTEVATLKLHYGDSSSTNLPIIYAQHVREWFGARHEKGFAFIDGRTKTAWHAEFAEASKLDREVRLFHAVLTNPFPDKVVKTLSLHAADHGAAFMVAALSVGAANAPLLTNTFVVKEDFEKRPTQTLPIVGKVKTLEGKPVAGAIVKILGTRPLKTPETETDFDHAASGLQTATSASGDFSFPPQPDNLLYRLIVLADEFAPGSFPGVAPARGPIEIRLTKAEPLKPSKKYYIHARVIDQKGEPVVGATVNIQGIQEDSSRMWGGSTGLPDQTTDGHGEFLIQRDKEFSQLQLNINMIGLAREKLWLPASNVVQTVQLGEGARLVGRVLKDGKPLPHVKLAVSGADRSADVYAGDFYAHTDDNGAFAFKHLPPRVTWHLYGTIESLQAHGAVVSRTVLTPAHGEEREVGDLQVTKGLTLAGKVQSRDGGPLPAGLAILISCADTGYIQARANSDGAFEASGLFPGSISVGVQPHQWQLAPENRSLDDWNPWRMVGLLHRDKTDLLLIIEKKPRTYHGNSDNGHMPQQDRAASRPLFGAEPSGPAPIIFAGTVIDDDTEKPIKSGTILPGRKPPVTTPAAAQKPVLQHLVEAFRPKPVPWNERPFWDRARLETFTNGTFRLGMVPLSSTPLLRVEAEGYLPFESEPMPNSNTSLVIRLSKGKGPQGTVLLPNGKPAENATIIHAASSEQFGLDRDGSLSNYGGKGTERTTKSDGRFSFPARSGSQRLFVSHPVGWAMELTSRLSDDSTIKLLPWAQVTGVLVDKQGKPVANEMLSVSMPHDWGRGDAFVNIQEWPKTDATGRFHFKRVPPGELELIRMVPSNGGGWTHSSQMKLYAEPGKTNDLGKVTMDSPPPTSVLDELKKKIGL